ncbi:MAG: hypothetical protein ACRELC_14190 [Gemmatimonadota bacterium]
MSSRSRGDRRAPQPERRGLLSGMSAPPIDEMPRIRTAFTRGLAGTWSSPVVVGAIVAWLLLEWIVLVAVGFPGPFALLSHLSAAAPLSTTADLSISVGIFGFARGLPFVFVVAAVHALWYSMLVGLAIEAVETGTPSRWGAIRGLRAFPVAFALHLIGVPVLFASQLVSGLAGGGLSFVLQLAVLVVTVWAFAFAPIIAVADRRRLLDSLGRSLRAARLPGSGNLSFVAIYVLPVFATFVAIGVGSVPGADLDVNPSYTAWIFVTFVNLLHGAVLAALALRYLSVAAQVPDPPARPTRGADRRPGSRARMRGRR